MPNVAGGYLPLYSFDLVEALEMLQNFALTVERLLLETVLEKSEKGDCRISALQLPDVPCALKRLSFAVPVSTFVGTTAICANFEAAPVVENLGLGTQRF